MSPNRLALINRRSLLAALLSLPAWALARPSAAALALLLASDASPGVDPAGHLVSEKYDGVRAVWDGSRLRFRSGLSIAAPDWFTRGLPAEALDGELWLGRGRFDASAAAVRRSTPVDAEWRGLHYMVFEQPGGTGTFNDRVTALQALHAAAVKAAAATTPGHHPTWTVAPQALVATRAQLQQRLHAVVQAGGEGLVLHRADAPYSTGRSTVLLKLKPLHDADALVVGHTPGRGRHAGRLGALQVQLDDGTRFLLGTGFTDEQRDAPPPIGSIVTFTHRGVTPAGVPRFASFLRVRPV